MVKVTNEMREVGKNCLGKSRMLADWGDVAENIFKAMAQASGTSPCGKPAFLDDYCPHDMDAQPRIPCKDCPARR